MTSRKSKSRGDGKRISLLTIRLSPHNINIGHCHTDTNTTLSPLFQKKIENMINKNIFEHYFKNVILLNCEIFIS